MNEKLSNSSAKGCRTRILLTAYPSLTVPSVITSPVFSIKSAYRIDRNFSSILIISVSHRSERPVPR